MWNTGWHIYWTRFRFFRDLLDFKTAYYKLKREYRALQKFRGM